MTMSLIGLETMFNYYCNNFKRTSDALIIFIHWFLSNKGFRCLSDGVESELLPNEWNQLDDKYSFDYTRNGKGYSFQGVTNGSALVVSLTRISDDRTGRCAINTNVYVTSHFKDFNRVYSNLSDLIEILSREFNSFLNPENNNAQQDSSLRSSNTGRSRASVTHPGPFASPFTFGQPRFPPFEYGHADLDPFGGLYSRGGGMIFSPLHPLTRQVPPRPLPPGVRFDPLFPDMRPYHVIPDPDHVPPPGP